MSLTVTLSHRRRIAVASFAEASRVVRADIEADGVGSSEWYGHGAGRIFQGGKQVAYVSYNGRVWKGRDTSAVSGEEIKIDAVTAR